MHFPKFSPLLISLCYLAALPLARAEGEAPKSTPLAGIHEKLTNQKKLVIGYLGASVMAGSGASAPEKNSWRALVTEGLKAQYPDAEIVAVNTSVGGLGTDYANLHFSYDTLPKAPDLIFIDTYCNGPYDPDLSRTNEMLIRQIRKALPNTEIVFTYIYNRTGGGLDRYYSKGETPPAHVQLHALVEHYGIADIELGKVMFDEYQKNPRAPFLKDGVHPADAGHKLYADTILQFLKERITPGGKTRPLPSPLHKDAADAPNILDAQKLAGLGTGWKVDPRPLGFMPSFLTVADPANGAELSFSFTGSVIGIYWLQTFEGGQLEWSIDDQPPERLASASDFFIKRRITAAAYNRFKTKIPYGAHKLKIRALAEKPAGSAGNVIKIGAIITQ